MSLFVNIASPCKMVTSHPLPQPFGGGTDGMWGRREELSVPVSLKREKPQRSPLACHVTTLCKDHQKRKASQWVTLMLDDNSSKGVSHLFKTNRCLEPEPAAPSGLQVAHDL